MQPLRRTEKHHACPERPDLTELQDGIRKALIKYGTLRGKIRPEVANLIVIQEFLPPSERDGYGSSSSQDRGDPQYAFALLAPDSPGGVRVSLEEKERLDDAMRFMFSGYVEPDPRRITGDQAPENSPFGPDKKPSLAIYPISSRQNLAYIKRNITKYDETLRAEYSSLTQPSEADLLTGIVRAIAGDKSLSADGQSFERDGDYYDRLSLFGVSKDSKERLVGEIVKRFTEVGIDAQVEQSEYGAKALLRGASGGACGACKAAYPKVFAEVEGRLRKSEAERYKIALPEALAV